MPRWSKASALAMRVIKERCVNTRPPYEKHTFPSPAGPIPSKSIASMHVGYALMYTLVGIDSVRCLKNQREL